MRALLIVVSLFLLRSGPAGAQDVLDFVRADRWPEAQAEAARLADPIAGKLVTYYRLLAPGAATAQEIADFIADSPDWPAQAMLARRRDEALAGAQDDVARALCAATRPSLPPALLRCAETATGAAAAAFARDAWVSGVSDPGWEARFLARWAGALTPASEQQRFARLVLSDTAAAQRQMARLAPAMRAMAAARLALRADDPKAASLLAALPPAQRGDAALVLDEARWRRRAGDDAGALALWRQSGATAQAAAPAARLGAFWEERNLLARRLLRAGDAAAAYELAAGYTEGPAEDVLDAQFLAGFIALRRLNDTARAAPHFRALIDRSPSVITQGRGHYWLARTLQGEAATAEMRRAAEFPSSFYGQFAILALDPAPERLAAAIAVARDPPADAQRLRDWSGRELARAAAQLVAWGDRHRAQAFLLRLDETSPDPAERMLSARLAQGFGMQETAVAVARRAGRDGVALIEAGWPVAARVPANSPIEPALALGIIRQESNFDPLVISRSGARGLMQLMPATAAEVGRKLRVPVNVPALTTDTDANIRLGTFYLADLMQRFDGCTPFAVAAYNAGPGRVRDWLAGFGDPRTEDVAMLDWLELIPVAETRNYVQRVIENEVIYRARAGLALAHPLASWLR